MNNAPSVSSESLRRIGLWLQWLLVMLFVDWAAAWPAAAATLTVTSLADSGAGSLRAEIASAMDGDTVNFQAGLTGTITLSSGEIAIANSLTISGPGANVITVSGDSASRIFDATDGTKTLAISGLTLANGNAGAGMRGGAITTSGTLTVDGLLFQGNTAGDGGGALFVARNVVADAAAATISNCAFANNSVTDVSGVGGGAVLAEGNPTLANGPSLTLVNTTVSDNVANASVGMAGGGIAIATADLMIISSTIAFNTAGAAGTDIHQGTLQKTSVTIANSIIADGTIIASGDVSDSDLYQPGAATIASSGYNIVQQRSLATGYAPTDAVNGTDPALLALANNGGPTPTDALQPTSPAIHFVPDASCVVGGVPLKRDQRGAPRQVNGAPCDAGAFEIAVIVLAPATLPSGTAGVAYSQTITATGGFGTITFTLGGTLPTGLTLNSATGVLSGTPMQSGTFNFTITATDAFGDSSGAQPYTLSIGFGMANKLAFVQQPSDVGVGASIAPAVTVQVQDAFGDPIQSATLPITVAIGTNPGGGTLSGTLTQTSSGGIATFGNLSINKTGNGYTLAATSPGLFSATSSGFNVVPGAAAALVFGQQPTNTVAGASIAPAITVRIVDGQGNLTNSGATVTLAIGTNPGGGTLSGTASVAAVNGVATFADLSINKAGVGYTLGATSTGLAGATSSTFNITAGAPATLVFQQQPTNTATAVPIAPAVTAQILDGLGNLTNSGATVTMALGTNPSGATLSGTLAVPAVNGTATFANLSLDKPGVGFTLTATSPGLTPATSAPFNIANLLLTVPLPSGGVVTIALAGGGAACNFVGGGFVPLTGGPDSPPAGSAPQGFTFPFGLSTFTAMTCTSITLTYTFPSRLPAGSQFWKYGRTVANPAPHWYVMPATIGGDTAVITITDGGLGDDDLLVNGTIVDPGGIGVPASNATGIPTVAPIGLLLLAALLGLAGLAQLAARRSRRR